MLLIDTGIDQADGDTRTRLHQASLGKPKVGVGVVGLDRTETPLLGKLRCSVDLIDELLLFLSVPLHRNAAKARGLDAGSNAGIAATAGGTAAAGASRTDETASTTTTTAATGREESNGSRQPHRHRPPPNG